MNHAQATAAGTDGDGPAVTTAVPERPVSYGQQALYYLQQLRPASWAYNLPFCGRTARTLDASRLRRAVVRLLARHATLRTVYGTRGGRTFSIRPPDLPLDFAEVDASGLAERDVAAQVREECRRPFDLRRGPLLRVRLLRSAPPHSVLVLLTHHIAADLWSWEVVVEDLLRLYLDEEDGRGRAGAADVPGGGPAADYDEFIRWQRDLVAGPEGRRQWAYWKDVLGGELPVLNLQFAQGQPNQGGLAAGSEVFHVARDVSEALRAQARAAGTTLFRLLLSAYATLLFRHTGQQDVLVGTPFAGRPTQRFHPVVGDFVNLLPIRVDLSGRPCFREVIARIDLRVRDAMAHQDYPFPLLVTNLGLKAAPGRSALVQTTFALFKTHRLPGLDAFCLQNTTSGTLRVCDEIEFTPVGVTHQEGQFDLALEMVPREDGLSGAFKYDAKLLDAAAARRLADRFGVLLAALAQGPETPVSSLPLSAQAHEG